MIVKITENNVTVIAKKCDFGDDIQDCTQCESDLATCKDEKQAISDNLTACVSEKETLEADLSTCIADKETLETTITDLNSQITTLTDNLNTCTSDKETIQANLDTCLKEKATLEDTITNLNSQIETLTSDLDTCTTDKEAIQASLDTCIAEKADLQTALDAKTEEATQLSEDLATCVEEKTAIQESLDTCIEDKEALQTALDSANTTIATLNDRLDVANSRLDTMLGRVIDGDEVAKLDALDSDKLAIKTSIESKTGTTLTEDFSTYSTSIYAIPLDSYVIEPWEEQAGRSKMVALINLYPNNNNTFRYRIYSRDGGSLHVDWGDGVVEDLPNGYIEHTYDYDTLDSKVFSSDKKQALLTITTTDETDAFKDIDAQQKTSLNILSATMEHCKIECDYDGLLLDYACAYQANLKTFEFVGECNSTSMKYGFYTFGMIESVKFKNMNNVINLDHLFYYTKVSDFTVANGTVRPSSTQQMFYMSNTYNNYEENVVWGMSESTTLYYMYGNNHSVKSINFPNTGHLTSWSYFALDCYVVESIDVDMTSATSAIRAFEDLWNIRTINLTLLPVSTDITNCYLLPASEIENLILNQLKDVSENDANEVLKLTGTVTEDELSQDALDHAVAYGWDLVF